MFKTRCLLCTPSLTWYRLCDGILQDVEIYVYVLYVFLVFNYRLPLMANTFILQENTHVALSETILEKNVNKKRKYVSKFLTHWCDF